MSSLSTTIEGEVVEMKNPPHPGELIGDSLKELGVSVSRAARGLGITRQQLHSASRVSSFITSLPGAAP